MITVQQGRAAPQYMESLLAPESINLQDVQRAANTLRSFVMHNASPLTAEQLDLYKDTLAPDDPVRQAFIDHPGSIGQQVSGRGPFLRGLQLQGECLVLGEVAKNMPRNTAGAQHIGHLIVRAESTTTPPSDDSLELQFDMFADGAVCLNGELQAARHERPLRALWEELRMPDLVASEITAGTKIFVEDTTVGPAQITAANILLQSLV